MVTTSFGLFAAALFIIIRNPKMQETVENIDERLHAVHSSLNRFAHGDWEVHHAEVIKLEQKIYEIESKLRKGLFDDFKKESGAKDT